MREHRRRVSALGVLGVLSLGAVTGCVTVRPEQRAVLADPTMQFDSEAEEEAARQHVYDNREGSFGGGSVEGGGCGCRTTGAPMGPGAPLAALFMVMLAAARRRRRRS